MSSIEFKRLWRETLSQIRKIDFEIFILYCFFESLLSFIILSGYVARQTMVVSLEFYFLVYCPFCILVVNILIVVINNEIQNYKKNKLKHKGL